jgi:hypothetical protein
LKGVKVHGKYRDFFITFAVSLVPLFFFSSFLVEDRGVGFHEVGREGGG